MTRAQFMASVKEQPNGCWFRGSGTTPGSMDFNGRGQSASRVAWQLLRGAIPDSVFVLHKCDEPRCVNPDHLWLGTHADNMEDRGLKDRVYRPPAGKKKRDRGIVFMLDRIDAELWFAVKERAESEGRAIRWILLTFLRHYVEHGLPEKPAT